MHVSTIMQPLQVPGFECWVEYTDMDDDEEKHNCEVMTAMLAENRREAAGKEQSLKRNGTLDATNLGPQCWAPASFPGPRNATFSPIDPHAVSPVTGLSEDCLTMNVYRRATKSTSLLPVMVWIHGGEEHRRRRKRSHP